MEEKREEEEDEWKEEMRRRKKEKEEGTGREGRKTIWNAEEEGQTDKE